MLLIKVLRFKNLKTLENSKNKSFYEYRENPVILITGYWPPTNEMIRDFSQDLSLNPDGWIGNNWENKGMIFPVFRV